MYELIKFSPIHRLVETRYLIFATVYTYENLITGKRTSFRVPF